MDIMQNESELFFTPYDRDDLDQQQEVDGLENNAPV